MIDRCDVLVVGAGPAGSSAARAAAAAGAGVLVVDRRRTIGRPVQCAEHIPALLLRAVPAAADTVVQRVRGMRTVVCDEPAGELDAPGCMVDRDRFDRALAADAERAGARILTAVAALGVEDGAVVLRPRGGRPVRLRPQVVVGADGPKSIVRRWAGIAPPRLVPAVQARVRLARPMDTTEVYLDPAYRAGYAWLFPKGDLANAGVGYVPEPGGPSPGTLLARVLTMLRDRGRIAGPVAAYHAGWIPVAPVDRSVRGNFLLAGDAAGQAHPITGAGIAAAVACGRMAGEWAARAVAAGEPGLLRGYEDEWRDLFGETLARAAAKRRIMEAGWERFAEIIRSCWIGFDEYHRPADLSGERKGSRGLERRHA